MPPMRLARKFATFLTWTCLVAGCSGGGDNLHLKYGENARLAYVAALDEFYDDNCLEAEAMFRAVRREYPYARFAALSELRIADCLFEDAKFPEAIQSYRQFTRYRPSHVEVPYANFMIAASHFEQIPSEWLLSPPAHEREQYYAQESLRLLRRFILDHSNDPLVARAKGMAEEAVQLLARHELYVANFYLGRDYPMAAVGRLRTLLRSYPGSGLDAEALYLLGTTYVELQDDKRARSAFQQLVDRFPKDDYAARARGELSGLGG
jgi:outer membrane protein assembly factor BamD